MSAKSLFALTLLVVALAGGQYSADWLVLKFLHVDAPLAWNTWWQYFQALNLPQYLPYAVKVKAAGAIGFGVPLLVWLILLIALFKSKPESLHGDASFGDMGDAKKADLLRRTPQGLLIGKLRGRFLWLNGAQHLIMIAATRTGKTTSVAIPVLLTYQESMVVSDIKGELCKLTSGQRRAMGQRVHIWAPYDVDGRTHRFNPLTLLAASDARTRIAEIQTISAILYPDEASKDPFWSTQARAVFTALTSFLFERFEYNIRQLQELKVPVALWPHPNTSETFPSFERVLRFSAGEGGKSSKDMLQAIVTQTEQYPYVSPQTRTGLSNFVGLAEQTLSSVIATMQSPLQQFLSPILAASTNATDFDITAIRKRPTTIYVNIPTNKLDESASHPQSALYNTLKEEFPAGVSSELLSQCTAACYMAGIKQPNDLGNITGMNGSIIFESNSLFGNNARIDLSQPTPSVQQTMQNVQQFDQQQAINSAQFQAQQAQINAQAPNGPKQWEPGF